MLLVTIYRLNVVQSSKLIEEKISDYRSKSIQDSWENEKYIAREEFWAFKDTQLEAVKRSIEGQTRDEWLEEGNRGEKGNKMENREWWQATVSRETGVVDVRGRRLEFPPVLERASTAKFT